MDIIWKPHPLHRILASSHGRLWSISRKKEMARRFNCEYIKTNICKADNFNNVAQSIQVHRLIAETFHPNSNSENLVVNHIDGNTLNNNEDNLEWTTVSENNKVQARNTLYKTPLGIFSTFLEIAEAHNFKKSSDKAFVMLLENDEFPEWQLIKKAQ